MSATGRGAIRVENDVYATPDWCIDLLFDRVNWDNVLTAFEPCKDDGAIYDKLRKECIDVETDWAEIREGRDYLKSEWPQVDFSPSNPPYSLATEFLKKAFTHCKCVAYLLRINYLESEGREHTGPTPTNDMDTKESLELYRDAQDFISTEYMVDVPDPDPNWKGFKS